MDFDSFLTHISSLKNMPLGGIDSQFKMVPSNRKDFALKDYVKENPKDSAVMALFYPDEVNETKFLLTLRASLVAHILHRLVFQEEKLKSLILI